MANGNGFQKARRAAIAAVTAAGLAAAAASAFILSARPPDEPLSAAMAAAGDPDASLGGLPGFDPPRALSGPIVIGVQPGHWRIEELPDELARLRTSTGASYGSLRELDINLAVSRLAADKLNAAGYRVELLPAGVPAGYRADLFVSVHADRADRPERRGWKLSPPWRPSRRSKELAAAMAEAFRYSGLPQDSGGVTANMRGYFGFSWWRYVNALSPYTPAVLVEMGFMGNPEDRARMRDRPGLYADILVEGIRRFLADYDRGDLAALTPTVHPTRFAGNAGAVARSAPSAGAAIAERYETGRALRPVDAADGGWFEVYSRNLRRGVWVHESELE